MTVRQLRTRTARAGTLAAVLTVLVACGDRVAARPPELRQSGSADITVDPSTRLQVMRGWEATVQAAQEFPEFPAFRDDIWRLAVDSLGLNRLRLHVRSGVENRRDYYNELAANRVEEPPPWRCVRFSTVNDNDDPFSLDRSGFIYSELDHEMETVVVPIRQRLAARGERLFLNVNYVAFTKQICGDLSYHHSDPEEYAEFVLATYLHLRDRWGIEPDAWEVILEPDNSKEWTREHVRAATAAAARRLRAAGFTPHFVAPSTASMALANDYFDEMRKDSMAVAYLDELSYHRYRNVSRGALEGLATRARSIGIGTSMLEHIGSGYEDLHEDIEVGGAVAWQQFALAWPRPVSKRPDDGGAFIHVDRTDPARPAVRFATRSRLLSQYFRHVRLGAQRVAAASTNERLHPLAFVNASGSMTVVIRAERGARFAVAGLAAGRYGVSWGEEDGPGGAYPDVDVGTGDRLHVTIPSRGALTIHGR